MKRTRARSGAGERKKGQREAGEGQNGQLMETGAKETMGSITITRIMCVCKDRGGGGGPVLDASRQGPRLYAPVAFQQAETNSLFSPRSSRNGVATHACRCVSIRSLRVHAELLFFLAHLTHRSVQTSIISFLRRSSIMLLPSQFLKNTSKLFETGTLRGRMLVVCGDDSRM